MNSAVMARGFLAIALAAVVSATQPAPVRPFVITDARGGRLLPIARFDGQRWLNTWPVPAEDPVTVPSLNDVPASWLGGPVPRRWTVWPLDGHPASVSAVRTFRDTGGCARPIYLEYDKSVGSPDGLAINTDERPETLRKIASTDPLLARLRPSFESALRSSARPVLELFFKQPDERRAAMDALIANGALTIDSVYQLDRMDGGPIYFFDVSKAEPQPRREVRGIRAAGWIREDNGAQPATLRAMGGLIGGDAAVFWTLDGVVRIHDRDYWIVTEFGYERSASLLFDVDRSTVRTVLTTSGGGC